MCQKIVIKRFWHADLLYNSRKSDHIVQNTPNQSDVVALLLQLRATEANPECSTEDESFGALMQIYLPLIEKTVSRFDQESSPEREDLRQEALMGFYRAAMSYDAEQNGVSFGLYAQICMTNRLVSFCRSYARNEALLVTDGEDEMPISDEDSPSAEIMKAELLQDIYEVLRRVLSPFEYKIWECYVRGESAREIAKAVGTGEKSVTNAIGRIRRKLRDARSEFDF